MCGPALRLLLIAPPDASVPWTVMLRGSRWGRLLWGAMNASLWGGALVAVVVVDVGGGAFVLAVEVPGIPR